MDTKIMFPTATYRPSKFHERTGLIFLAALLTILSTYTLRDIGEPRPQVYMLINGFILSALLNAGLWMSAFQPSGIWRYPVALYLIPESIGIGFVLWFWHWSFGVAGIIFHLYLAVKIFKSEKVF